jgi:hypothetical protein
MKKLIALSLVLVSVISGCSVEIGGRLFYPEARTKHGGSFGDPRETRKNELKYSQFRVSPVQQERKSKDYYKKGDGR